MSSIRSTNRRLEDSSEPAPPSRAAFAFIFVTALLDMLALGVITPVLPRLVKDFLGGETAAAATIFGLFGTVWAAMQFVFSPVLGALSDRYGRRPVVLLSNLGLGLDYLVMAVAPSLWWLFVGRIVSGITASSFAVAGAYVADVTPLERRAASFGMLSAAFGVGFIVGPALGGLAGSIDVRLPFWIAAALSLANAAYGFFILPESLPEARRASFDLTKANPLGSLRLLRSHRQLLGLGISGFLSRIAHDALPSTFVLYAQYRYGWDERSVGFSLAGIGACSLVAQAGFVRPAVAHLGERGLLLAGLGAGVAGFLTFGLAPTSPLLLAGVPLIALYGLALPARQGLMTRRVTAAEQGQLQGAQASLTGIAGTFAPVLFTTTFAAFIAERSPLRLPGAPFILAAILLIVAAILAWRVTRPESELSGRARS